MTQLACGIEIGDFIGSGCFSQVYEYPQDDSKVVMTGRLGNDTIKLALYNAIGALFTINLDSDSGVYAAVLEKMGNERSNWDELDNATNDADSIYYGVDRTDQKLNALIEWSTIPQTNNRTAEVLFFMLEHGITSFSWDNKPANWLIDSNGNTLPMDVFHRARGSHDKISESIQDKITPIES